MTELTACPGSGDYSDILEIGLLHCQFNRQHAKFKEYKDRERFLSLK